MRKTLYFFWSLFLLIFFILIGIRFYNSYKEIDGINCNTVQLMDSLSKNTTDIILLTIVHEGCSTCESLLNRNDYKQLHFRKFYINKFADKDSKLITQALFTKGFPTTYILGPNLEILGNIEGLRYFSHKMEDCLRNEKRISDIKIPNIKEDSVLQLKTLSFKALSHFLLNDIEQVKQYALQSLDRGSYFFNNYLMFECYRSENNIDSAFLYRTKALEHIHKVDEYIYDNLIDTLKTFVP